MCRPLALPQAGLPAYQKGSYVYFSMLQAFVDFDSGAEAERAITTKDRQVFAPKFGHRYVRLVQVCLDCKWR